MNTVIQFSVSEETKALPILLRHSRGTILPDRTYVVTEDAARALRQAGIRFSVLSRESVAPSIQGAGSSERV